MQEPFHLNLAANWIYLNDEFTSLDDTIAAIATPTEWGELPSSASAAKRRLLSLIRFFRSRHPLRECPSHTVHLGSIASRDGEMIDSVLATVFHGPHSYTGETVVELSCHGGIYISRRVLCSVIAAGARLARPGEFTERAFLNGKMDLTQAEAVADLIHSQSESFAELRLSSSTEDWAIASENCARNLSIYVRYWS